MRSYRGAQAVERPRCRPGHDHRTGLRGWVLGSLPGLRGSVPRAGDRIKSPGKGLGAYHLGCKMFTDRRPASDEREAQRAEIKESIRSWNSIR